MDETDIPLEERLLRNRVTAARLRCRERKQAPPDDGTTVAHEAPTPVLFWSPRLSTILAGLVDETSPWHLLQGYEDTLLRDIYSRAAPDLERAVQVTLPACRVGRMRQRLIGQKDQDWAVHSQTGGMVAVRNVVWHVDSGRFHTSDVGTTIHDRPPVAFATSGKLKFPKPTGLSIHMMPFIMGDVHSLPDNVQHYASCILQCPVQDSELGRVCYLSIHEGGVLPRLADAAPLAHGGLRMAHHRPRVSRGTFAAAVEAFHFGRGWAQGPDEVRGGLFVASTATSAVYNALVVDTSDVNRRGDIEYLRPHVGAPHVMQPNELVWLTDCTPYERLSAMDESKQCFQLVTSDIGVWYKDDSTPNPLVSLPSYVTVIQRTHDNATR